MSDSSQFFGPNAGYALALYEQYRQDPASVDAETRAFFDTLPSDAFTIHAFSPAERSSSPTTADTKVSSSLHATNGVATPVSIASVAGTARLARFIRQRGHLEANVDPLGLLPRLNAELTLDAHGLTEGDLADLPSSVVGGPIAKKTSNALDAIRRLREVYTGTIGYDDEHIENNEERYWLRDSAESGEFFEDLDAQWKRDILQRLTEVDTFEQYLEKTWPRAKRFSIEGTDVMVPMLDEIIHNAARSGVREVVLAMAHRGRLNMLAHVLGKPYEAILVAFDDAKNSPSESVSEGGNRGYSGDVKYHLGYSRAYQESGVAEMPITLVPNPSHLEFVNAVAVGHARAAQEVRTHPGAPERDGKASLPILIHGDAAFPGQGIVAETLNLSRLKGYSTDGTIHIIANNQIGFTTDPKDGRSTEYASDLAKGFEIPIVHVNADDPIACIAAARMACAYRERFHKDFLIDLVGYRRYGHNEGDNPEFTQPLMYEVVNRHPRLREIWEQKLVQEGLVSKEQAESLVVTVFKALYSARNTPIKPDTHDTVASSADTYTGPRNTTPISQTQLLEMNAALLARPEGFQADPKLERRVLQPRQSLIQEENGIVWGHAETLAFASILADGTPIRLTGQDCERGTFGHRNAVLHDTATGRTYVPLHAFAASRASFTVYNSPLSENAALGFEYGYNIHAPETLTLWEAQYGDFANGAQVIIDQFLVSGKAKWDQPSSLVLLLPHGYEGGGPEHSSARLERYLQLAANHNICVVNCTSAAQYFHLLRRQAAQLGQDPRPLIVMTPKLLLRHNRAFSSLSELAEGAFQSVIDDASAQERAEEVTRLILCSGKIYVDMAFEGSSPFAERKAFVEATQVALVRVEQLYPFPGEELKRVIAAYPNLRELVWMQEEPRNMGAWSFMEVRLRDEAAWTGPLLYVGRPEAASPAEGSLSRHTATQQRILETALNTVPPADLEGWGLGSRRMK